MATQNDGRKMVPVLALAPALRTASSTTSAIDSAKFESMAILFIGGSVTDGSHLPSVEHTDDDPAGSPTWSSAAADLRGDTLAAFIDSNDEKIYRVSYVGAKRYIRLKVTVSGSPSTGGIVSAVVIKGSPLEPSEV